MCAEGLARILVFVVNFCFVLVGVALLSLGILYTVNFSNFTETIPGDYQIQHIPTIAIVVGSIIFFIAFLGCCGTLRSNSCMLTTYASILFVIFLVQVALGVYALLQIKNTDDLKNSISTETRKLFTRYKESSDIAGTIDIIQQSLECCGPAGPLSWVPILQIPPNSCYEDPSDVKTLYGKGCADAIFNYLTGSIKLVAIVALAISATEVIAAILALFLANIINANKRRNVYR